MKSLCKINFITEKPRKLNPSLSNSNFYSKRRKIKAIKYLRKLNRIKNKNSKLIFNRIRKADFIKQTKQIK